MLKSLNAIVFDDMPIDTEMRVPTLRTRARQKRDRMASRSPTDSGYVLSAASRTPASSERRRAARDGVATEASRSRLVALVLGTYAEMPGLSLYLNQAARLFGLRETTCQVVLDDLVREGRLGKSSDGQYRQSSGRF